MDDNTAQTDSATSSGFFASTSLPGLTVVTLNCGAGGFRRRIREVSPAARQALHEADVVCLQECRVSRVIDFAHPDEFRAFLGESAPVPQRGLLTRDAGIIIRNPAITIESYDHGPRWAFARLRLPGLTGPPPTLSIFSVHGPFRIGEWQPIAAALRQLHPDPALPCIVGADWNSVPDPILDSLNGRSFTVPWAAPASALAHLRLADTFRHRHPTDPGWTYLSLTRSPTGPSLASARRLDGIMSSAILLSALASVQTVHTSSDHRAVVASFGPHGPAAPPAPRLPAVHHHLTWALHPGLWLSAPFVSAVRHFAEHYAPTHHLSRP
ncbi:hypothetical protein V8E36_002404, partial [Tilletia maclaganii]